LQSFKEKESNDFDEELSRFLKTVFYKAAFNDGNFKQLTDKIIEIQPDSLTKLLSLRFSAIKHYYKGDFSEALLQLQLALTETIENESIPNWLSLDVAIDIRNIIGIINELNSQFSIDNIGQKFIDENPEALYYPQIDRLVSSYQSNLLKHYFEIRYSSPYTVNLGGIDSLFTPVVQTFCVAFSNGSLIHILMTKKYTTEILFALSSLYNDHDFKAELIRESIINRDKSKLETIDRAYEIGSEMINATDANEIMNSLNNIECVPYRMMSKYLALTYLGYYFDDESYKKHSAELLEYTRQWINDKNRIFNFGDYIYKYLKGNYYRINNDQTIELVLLVFDSGLSRWYDNCMRIMQELDFSMVSPENQKHIMNMFISVIGDKENHSRISWNNAVIAFATSASIDIEKLETALKKHVPDFYENEFCLELLPNSSHDLRRFIEKNVESAKKENETQGVEGKYSGYASNPLETIKNIISLAEIHLDDEIIYKIAEVSVDTMEHQKQLASAKSRATELLIVLHYLYPDKSCWVEIQKILIEKATIFTHGIEMGLFDKYTNNNLRFAYDLLLLSFGQGNEEDDLGYLLTLDSDDTYGIIDALRLLYNLFSHSVESAFSENFLSGCANYAIIMSSANERDIKFYSVKCLIEMTKYENLQKIILQHLSKIMDNGTQIIKTTIVSRVKKIQSKNSEYTDYILKKASVDNNFLVRLVAQNNS